MEKNHWTIFLLKALKYQFWVFLTSIKCMTFLNSKNVIKNYLEKFTIALNKIRFLKNIIIFTITTNTKKQQDNSYFSFTFNAKIQTFHMESPRYKTNFWHPLCQRILLGVLGITALIWWEYCSFFLYSCTEYILPAFIELLCPKNHRMRWYLSSQGVWQTSLDLNALSTKDNGIYWHFRERQFVIFFMIKGY